MTVRFDFDFDSYDDFDEFLDKHEAIINLMDNSDRDLTEQMRYSVQANEQLPEYFEFSDTQYTAMLKRNASGMKTLTKDRRVSVTYPDDDADQAQAD